MKDPDKNDPAPRDQPDPRLPYEPPAVVSEEVFETLALSCGDTIFCQNNPPGMS